MDQVQRDLSVRSSANPQVFDPTQVSQIMSQLNQDIGVNAIGAGASG